MILICCIFSLSNVHVAMDKPICCNSHFQLLQQYFSICCRTNLLLTQFVPSGIFNCCSSYFLMLHEWIFVGDVAERDFCCCSRCFHLLQQMFTMFTYIYLFVASTTFDFCLQVVGFNNIFIFAAIFPSRCLATRSFDGLRIEHQGERIPPVVVVWNKVLCCNGALFCPGPMTVRTVWATTIDDCWTVQWESTPVGRPGASRAHFRILAVPLHCRNYSNVFSSGFFDIYGNKRTSSFLTAIYSKVKYIMNL